MLSGVLGALVVLILAALFVLWATMPEGEDGSPPTPSATAGVYLSDAEIGFTITFGDDSKKEVPSGAVLEVMPGARLLIEMSVRVNQSPFPRDLTYRYFASKGNIPEEFSGPRSSYVAPDMTESDTITVMITDTATSHTIIRHINVEIKEELP